jgi:hypothetical protein
MSDAPARKFKLGSMPKLKPRTRSGSSSKENNNQNMVQLKLVQIGVWSAVKAGLFITIAAGVATMAGFFILWLVVGQLGLLSSLNTLLGAVFGEGVLDIEQQLSLPRVMSFATAVSLFNILAGTALAAVYAMIFNVIGKITGGVAVSFTKN